MIGDLLDALGGEQVIGDPVPTVAPEAVVQATDHSLPPWESAAD